MAVMGVIRTAALQDLPGAYRVCLQTGASGKDATPGFHNPDLLGHVYVGPYMVGQPGLSLVVADEEGIGGYALAAADTRAFEAWAEQDWWPLLRRQYPLGNGDTEDGEVIRLLHSPPHALDKIVVDYPAHLHIDLLPRMRGKGHGRGLIEALLIALRSMGSYGVHLEVGAGNVNAIAFYRHLGFAQLSGTGSSLLMGMKLP